MGPRIGITGVTRLAGGTERSVVNAAYVYSVTAVGGVPLVLPPQIGPAQVESVLDAVDGVLLTGGEDIEPATYGQRPHPKEDRPDPARDAFEIALFHAAWGRRVPVLAICRGQQLTNVALGGTLWQDLPSQRPGPIIHSHSGARDQRTHRVAVTPNSRLARSLGGIEHRVNSFHHQAIRVLAPGLRVTAHAPDGVIEGVESEAGAPWLLAVQWHPEEFFRDQDASDRGLFETLIREAMRTGALGRAER